MKTSVHEVLIETSVRLTRFVIRDVDICMLVHTKKSNSTLSPSSSSSAYIYISYLNSIYMTKRHVALCR